MNKIAVGLICAAVVVTAPAWGTAAIMAASSLKTTTVVDQSADTLLVRDDGLWVDIKVTCYPKGIRTDISCKQSVADYQRIVSTMRSVGFHNRAFSANAPIMQSDIAYRIRISPNMGGGLSYGVDTPHPGLSAQMTTSMPVSNVSQLPKKLADLHRHFQQAMNNMGGGEGHYVRIRTNP